MMSVDPFLVPLRMVAAFAKIERAHLDKQLLKSIHADVQVFDSGMTPTPT